MLSGWYSTAQLEIRVFLVFSDGRISEMGGYHELLRDGKEFARLVEEFRAKDDSIADEEVLANKPLLEAGLTQNTMQAEYEEMPLLDERTSQCDISHEQVAESNPNLILAEKLETGRVRNLICFQKSRLLLQVKFSVYMQYFKAMSYRVALSILLILAVNNAMSIIRNIWLTEWLVEFKIHYDK
jgi:hypothetical protein